MAAGWPSDYPGGARQFCALPARHRIAVSEGDGCLVLGATLTSDRWLARQHMACSTSGWTVAGWIGAPALISHRVAGGRSAPEAHRLSSRC